MLVLKNVIVRQRSPLIVTADAFSATARKREYRSQNMRCLFEGVEHFIVAGMSRGGFEAGIQIGESMLMQLAPASTSAA